MKSAVLFLVFNRPETTQQVFNAIREAKPPRLYVAADGPRTNREGEHERCKEVRRIATTVDWACEVKTLFRKENLGCKMGVSGGINWFFEHEEEGIILEDDVLPVPSFFPYCDELLEYYREEKRIGLISGNNFIYDLYPHQESYYFSRYPFIWGWATWRRAWQLYDVMMHSWPEFRDNIGIKSISDGNKLFETYWIDIFNNVYQNRIDTWDYQWTFTCWYYGMISIIPLHNQNHNLGFGAGATHTTTTKPDFINNSIPKSLTFPLHHPECIEIKSDVDALIDQRVFGISKKTILKRSIRQIPILGTVLCKLKNFFPV